MTKPHTLAAILLLSALATPALGQGTGGSDNGTPPAASQPATGTPPSPASGPNPSGTEPASPAPAVIRNPTAQVQEWLQQLGLYNGDIDGKSGPQTRAAVIDFQRSHGLRPTGALDVATVARLRYTIENPQSAQGNNTGQEPAPNEPAPNARTDNSTSNSTAEATPPVRRLPGSSTSPGARTNPGSSTTARSTVTVPGLAAPGLGFGAIPGLGYGTSTAESSAPSGAGFGTGPASSFFGTQLNLSNGYNAAIGQGR